MPNFITTQISGVLKVPRLPSSVVVPTGVGSWLSNSIAQPYFPSIDINQLPTPVNVGTYFKPPVAIFFTSSTIGQPTATLEYLIPGVMQIGTYFKAPLAPRGTASWLSNTIGQPYITLYPQQPVFPFTKTPIVVILPTGIASWLGQSISQPYFPAFDINPSLIAPINVSTYFKAPQAIFFASNTITQPTVALDYLIPNVVRVPFIPSIVVVPTGYASWASSTIGQPYILSSNNQIVTDLSFLRSLAGGATLVTRLLLGVGL